LILTRPSHHRQSPPLIRTKTTESLFADAGNRLLQQNLLGAGALHSKAEIATLLGSWIIKLATFRHES
jgi:hypothetical protein